MIDIKSKRCCENNCRLRPYYNFLNKSNAIYCNKHKKEINALKTPQGRVRRQSKLDEVLSFFTYRELTGYEEYDGFYDGYSACVTEDTIPAEDFFTLFSLQEFENVAHLSL